MGTQMSGNTASTNGANGLRLAGTLTGTSTLSGNLGFAYVLEEHNDRIGSIYIPTGSTLVIQPGAVFKGMPSSFNYGKGTGLEVLGTLWATGTEEQPIIFTSIRDDTYSGDTNQRWELRPPAPGDWTRLVVGAGGLPRWITSSSAMLAAGFTAKLRKASVTMGGRSLYTIARSNLAA